MAGDAHEHTSASSGLNPRSSLDGLLRNLALAGRAVRTLALATLPSQPGSLGAFVEKNAARTPDKPALLFEQHRWTWAQLDEVANRVAQWFLARGARSGDVVALALGNRPETVFALAGLNKIGVIAALPHAGVRGEPLRHALTSVAPRWILAAPWNVLDVRTDGVAGDAELIVWDDGFRAALGASSTERPGSAHVQPGDAVALYMFTSGTTGLPKAARITNRRFTLMSLGFAHTIGAMRPDDVTYCALPLSHATGAMGGLGGVAAAGTTLAIRDGFSTSAFWADCVAYGATVVPYIGEVCRFLLQAPESPDEHRHHVRLFYGAGLRRDVWIAFQARFRVPEIVEYYGSTEGNVALVNVEGVPGMIGRINFGQSVIRVDPETGEPLRDASGRVSEAAEGEPGMLIGRISALTRFDGYTDHAATERKILRDAFGDGHDWFATGDLVVKHPGGFLSFSDRLGDTYRWKGENVSTAQVADVLARASGVRDAMVYGVEVPRHEGRAGMAALVTDPGFAPERFAAEVAASLPRASRPVFLRILETPDLTASFKYVTTRFKREGFDPHVVADPLWVASGDGYERLTPEVHDRLRAGAIRL
ncbi:AMP-binding protein [Candidatus Binatia bacterium]|nr:AMP-binding protein [Candidatus Binatia bacterium]